MIDDSIYLSFYRFLKSLYSSEAFKECYPFKNSLNHELTQTSKKSAIEWFESLNQHQMLFKTDEDPLKKLAQIVKELFLGLYSIAKYYSPIFEK